MADAPRCENCQTELAPTATFCPRCGHRPPAAAAAPPPVAPPVVAPVCAPAVPPAPSPVPPVPPASPVVAATPRRSSVVPAVLIGCGVLFLLLGVIGGYAAYRGYHQAKAEWAHLQTETETTTKPDADSTETTTDDSDTGTATDDAPTTDTSKPVIEVGSGMDPANPPRAYSVERVPPLTVEEGKPFGPVSNGDQAAGLVLAQPETQEWIEAVKQARAEGKRRAAMLTVELIPGSGNYLVHVFESVMDDEPGHTATFGWFKVDKETGAVTNQTLDSN